MLERCRAEASTLDHVVAGLGLGVADAAMALARLERSGWVRDAGGWFEPVLRMSGLIRRRLAGADPVGPGRAASHAVRVHR